MNLDIETVDRCDPVIEFCDVDGDRDDPLNARCRRRVHASDPDDRIERACLIVVLT